MIIQPWRCDVVEQAERGWQPARRADVTGEHVSWGKLLVLDCGRNESHAGSMT